MCSIFGVCVSQYQPFEPHFSQENFLNYAYSCGPALSPWIIGVYPLYLPPTPTKSARMGNIFSLKQGNKGNFGSESVPQEEPVTQQPTSHRSTMSLSMTRHTLPSACVSSLNRLFCAVLFDYVRINARFTAYPSFSILFSSTNPMNAIHIVLLLWYL